MGPTLAGVEEASPRLLAVLARGSATPLRSGFSPLESPGVVAPLDPRLLSCDPSGMLEKASLWNRTATMNLFSKSRRQLGG